MFAPATQARIGCWDVLRGMISNTMLHYITRSGRPLLWHVWQNSWFTVAWEIGICMIAWVAQDIEYAVQTIRVWGLHSYRLRTMQTQQMQSPYVLCSKAGVAGISCFQLRPWRGPWFVTLLALTFRHCFRSHVPKGLEPECAVFFLGFLLCSFIFTDIWAGACCLHMDQLVYVWSLPSFQLQALDTWLAGISLSEVSMDIGCCKRCFQQTCSLINMW